MKTLLLLLTLAYPSLALAQDAPPGYRWQCSNGTCRLIQTFETAAPDRLAALEAKIDRLTARIDTVANADGYVTFKPEPLAETPFRFATYETPVAGGQPLPWVSAGSIALPAATASTCNCSVTGVCTCDPATCMCASCVNGATRMAAMSGQYETAAIGPNARVIRPRRAAKHASRAAHHSAKAAFHQGLANFYGGN